MKTLSVIGVAARLLATLAAISTPSISSAQDVLGGLLRSAHDAAGPGMGQGKYKKLSDDIVSVAYWYQSEPHAPFPKLPSAAERLRDATHAGTLRAAEPKTAQ